MTTRALRGHRPGRALIPLLAALVLLWSPPPSGAAPGTATDPDDVDLRLDLKAASHTNDGSSITYTVETYEDFPDRHVDFKWLIDKDGDGEFDLIVTTQWEDSGVVASVDDPREHPVGDATVSRPAGNAIRVSISTGVLKGATSYSYRVSAISDLDNNGETDNGEQDLAPNTGLYQHSLASVTPSPGGTTTTTAPPATVLSTPLPSTVTPAPAPLSPVPSPSPSGSPSPSPSKAAPAIPARGAAPSVAGASGARVPSASAAPAGPNPPLARTGWGSDGLARLGAGMTLAGVGLLILRSRPSLWRHPLPRKTPS